MSDETLAAVDRALADAPDADEALRRVVRLLAARPGVAWAGIAFVETVGLVLGPAAGDEDEARRQVATISYRGEVVGELRVDGDAEPGFLAALAERLSAHVLLGWDTGGERWEP
jgi:hypothetical protein